MGLAEGCKLKRDIPQDQEITWDDVEFDQNLTKHQLYQEQLSLFPS